VKTREQGLKNLRPEASEMTTTKSETGAKDLNSEVLGMTTTTLKRVQT
jgi:hypothetical protein